MEMLMRGILVIAMLLCTAAAALAADKPFCTTSKFVSIDGTCLPDFICEGNKQVVGDCFDVHGQLLFDAQMRMSMIVPKREYRLWLTSICRQLRDTAYACDHEPYQPEAAGDYMPLPARVANMMDDATDVVADYRVCPLNHEKTVTVCIESAKNLVPIRSGCGACTGRRHLPDAAFKDTPQ